MPITVNVCEGCTFYDSANRSCCCEIVCEHLHEGLENGKIKVRKKIINIPRKQEIE